MKEAERKKAYKLVTDLASTDEAGGLAKERSVLLLWFLRYAVGLDDLEAYDYICDGDLDRGVDALYLKERQEDDDVDTLVVYQSYFTKSARDVGSTKLDRLIAAANHFKSSAALTGLLAGRVEEALRRLVADYELPARLANADVENERLRIRLVLVTTGVLDEDATQLVAATNATEGPGYLSVYDLSRLSSLAQVVAAPGSEVDHLEVPLAGNRHLAVTTHANGNRVAIAPVRATVIARWEGLEDRRLFALNVRREFRQNRVRRQLDAAIRREQDHADFLACHNGMTVTCASFEASDSSKLIVHHPSVVNGAQSAIAFLASLAGRTPHGRPADFC